MGGVLQYTSKVSGSGVDLTLLIKDSSARVSHVAVLKTERSNMCTCNTSSSQLFLGSANTSKPPPAYAGLVEVIRCSQVAVAMPRL